MKHTVCVVTGSRAEYGLLKPLIQKLTNDKEVILELVVTGSHLSEQYGNTQNEILKDGFFISKRIFLDLDGDTKADMADSTGKAISLFASYFEKKRPSMLIVLGDRYEVFAASFAAAMQGIAIAHIHGGEITEGAVDDFLRHSITKMSYIHFTACEEYRNRVIQLGEDPERVFNVGALGVENALGLSEAPISEIENELGIELNGDIAIVTYHPVTQENNTSEKEVSELIEAMDCFNQMKFIITKSNADAGGRLINSIWETEAEKRENWKVVTSLGSIRYLTLLKKSRFIIGNSSSGIIEAPTVHVTTINIGDRQKGRFMADSVICCLPSKECICSAITRAMSDKQQSITNSVISPFGNGKTSEKIYQIIKEYLNDGILNTAKHFYDIKNQK